MGKDWQESWRKKWGRPKNAPKLPDVLPGKFVVIEYQKDYERYLIHMDNKDRSSYDLGSNMEFILHQFAQWDKKKLLSDTLDLAKEFGAAQGIFEDGRTIAIFERGKDKSQVVFRDGEEVRTSGYIPTLRG